MTTAEYDVVVVGASLGGVAAALAAAHGACTVCLVEPGSWAGGQMTVQGVCRPDDTGAVNTISGTRTYRTFRNRCRDYYRKNYKLSALGASAPVFNAGAPYMADQMNFSVSPKLGDTVLKHMLAEASSLHPRFGWTVVRANLQNDVVADLTVSGPGEEEITLTAKYFLDATDLGDLLPMVLPEDEYVIGAESHADTQEPLNVGVDEPRPTWMQPITYCIALVHLDPGKKHPIVPKPASYDTVFAEQRYSLADGNINKVFANDPWTLNMWNYRRYIWARNFNDPAMRYDRSMINTRSNDYQGSSIPYDPALDEETLAKAREASLGYLYWLQTACPRDEDPSKLGYPELQPDADAFDTKDGIAPTPYIRESRRIRALKRVVAQDIMRKNGALRAVNYPDSCGIGYYSYMDVHELAGAVPPMPQSGAPILPFQIPAAALVSRRISNFLAACKNIGTTHYTSGAYRLHPIEWNAGESAGALAAFCVRAKASPKSVVQSADLLKRYQHDLVDAGISIYWWTDVYDGNPLYKATQMVGIWEVMNAQDSKLRFNPNDPLTDPERTRIEGKFGAKLPSGPLSRGHAATWLLTSGHT